MSRNERSCILDEASDASLNLVDEPTIEGALALRRSLVLPVEFLGLRSQWRRARLAVKSTLAIAIVFTTGFLAAVLAARVTGTPLLNYYGYLCLLIAIAAVATSTLGAFNIQKWQWKASGIPRLEAPFKFAVVVEPWLTFGRPS